MKIMIRKILIALLLAGSLGSCTKDFKTVNIDPNNSPKVPLDYLLSQAELYIGGSAGDPGYATWRANLSEAYFVTQYPTAIKGLVDLISQASADPKQVNILSIARILRAMQTSLI